MPDQIQEIKSAVDIIELIGERMQLVRAGKNFKGLCPFHSEKTPSFFVTPELQRYKCFGCGKSGDVYTFLQEYDSLTFAEAIQQLADRTGITLEKHVFSQEDQRRQRLYEVLDLAKEYYHYLLTEHKLGEQARQYLKQRGMHAETIKTFQLGYALNSWDALQDYLIKKKKYSWDELEAVGLVISRLGTRTQNQTSPGYDRFRHRIIFPLTDLQGRVVGFSGRLMDSSAKEAKYINSPETALYHKSQLLFGYSVLKNFLRKEEEVIVVEGEFDALSSYQAEVKHVVAIKGSALTEQQVKLLSRSVKKIVLALDADSAGIEATKRAIQTAKDYDVSLRVLPLVGGKDPDDIAREYPKVWREMTKKTIAVYEFLIDAAFKGKNIETGEGKRDITKEVVPILSSISNAVEQAHYITKTSKRLGVKEEALETEVKKFDRRKTMPLSSIKVADSYAKKVHPKIEVIERYVCSLLFRMSNAEMRAALAELKSVEFTTSALKKLYDLLCVAARQTTFDPTAFARKVPAEYQEILSELYLEPIANTLDIEKEWKSTLEKFRAESRGGKMRELAEKLAILEQKSDRTEHDEQELQKLQDEFVVLSSESQA